MYLCSVRESTVSTATMRIALAAGVLDCGSGILVELWRYSELRRLLQQDESASTLGSRSFRKCDSTRWYVSLQMVSDMATL